MLSRTASLVARKVAPRASFAARTFSSDAAASSQATSVTLNLSVPYESIYNGAAVESVVIPGTEGEYGITVNHVPYVAQMKPGVLQVLFEGAEPEKYFVAGGYAVTHANSVTVSFIGWRCWINIAKVQLGKEIFLTRFLSYPILQDVVCVEAVKIDDIDPSAVQSNYDAAKSAAGAATSGSVEEAEALIDMEVNKAMGLAVGLTLA
jgi:F0F1-type ATP synthase epsilon subunit